MNTKKLKVPRIRYSTEITWDRELDRAVLRQKHLAKRIEKLGQIVEMRKKNKMTLRAIGERFGISRQAVDDALKILKLSDSQI